MDMVIKRFDVYFIDLDPTVGSEIKKTRPCVIISPDEVNRSLNTVIVAPLTSTIRRYPTRVECIIDKKSGQVALDQLRAIDKTRLGRKLGRLDTSTCDLILETVQALFS